MRISRGARGGETGVEREGAATRAYLVQTLDARQVHLLQEVRLRDAHRGRRCVRRAPREVRG